MEIKMSENNTKKPTKILTDEEIIALYWDRNEQAIKETDVKYRRYLYTISYNILRDDMDSEECLNDTYLGTWNSIPPRRPNAFQVFLAKITRNFALQKFRKQTAARRIPSELMVSLDELDECIGSGSTVEEEYMIRTISVVLNKFLRELSDRDSFIFVCRYYYSDSVAAIAKMLGTSDNTVYRRLKDMREALKKELEKEGCYYE